MEQKNVEGLEDRLAAIEATTGGVPGMKVDVDISAALTDIVSTPIELVAGVAGKTIVVHEAWLRAEKDGGAGIGQSNGLLKLQHDNLLSALNDPIADLNLDQFGGEEFEARFVKYGIFYTTLANSPKGASMYLRSDQNLAGEGLWRLMVTYSLLDS